MALASPPVFIPAQVRVDGSHPHIAFYANQTADDLKQRWKTEQGQRILLAWCKAKFDRKALSDLVGTFYDNLDARGAPLGRAIATGSDLSRIDLFSADCQAADFRGADLSGSFLSEANICKADFSWAKMKDAFLDSAQFDEETRFLGVNLNAVNFNLAALLRERAITQQRIADLERRYPTIALLLRITCDYGRSLTRWSAWVAAVIILCSLLYAIPGTLKPGGLWHAGYYSVMAFTTLGLWDVTPEKDWAKILTMVEVVLGYAMGGLFIAILTKKVIGD